MSTLRANTVSNSAGTGSPAITGGELSRARFNLNGTGTIAERGSFNISSYTDNGVGDYTANFTTAFPNANYSLTGMGTEATNSSNIALSTTAFPTTSAARIRSFQPGSAHGDTTHILVHFVGDRP